MPSEVAQPTRLGRVAHISVHRELQVVLDIILYQIGYFTCNYVPPGLLGTIDSSDPCTPSAMAPSPPDLLHVGLMSRLPDETGQCGGARVS
jgi:hypothetical protein